MKKCPFCAELIQDEAIKCRYCGSMLTGGTAAPADAVRTGAWQQDARNLVLQGQKIEAIKLVRGQTRAGLKDAKDFVEALERGESPPPPQPAANQPQGTGCALVFLAVLVGLAAALLTYFMRR